jgi:hypothetical protein
MKLENVNNKLVLFTVAISAFVLAYVLSDISPTPASYSEGYDAYTASSTVRASYVVLSSSTYDDIIDSLPGGGDRVVDISWNGSHWYATYKK